MRVLLLCNWFPPVLSGSSFYVSSLARALCDRGLDVAVVTLDWGPEYRPEQAPFPVYQLPVLKLPRLGMFYHMNLMGFAYTRANIRDLTKLVNRFQPHVLHQVNHIFDTVFLLNRVAKTSRIPIVGTITTPIQHQNRVMQKLMSFADKMIIGTFGIKHWDGIISLDRTVHSYVRSLYGRKAFSRSHVIPFGVRLTASRSYDGGSLSREGPPTILFVGHLHPFRNPTQLIRAMSIIKDRVPDARLILAGRVDLKEPEVVARELGLSPNTVRFLGETPHDEVIKLMKSAHILAHWAQGPFPSLGTVGMEAMLCNTPVISYVPEDLFGENTLRHNSNIILIDPDDPVSIAREVIGLLRDEVRRRQLAANGRKFVLEHLNWPRIAEQVEKFYNQILSETTQPGAWD